MGYFTDYPKHVFLILSNEFCERFSYYGMKSILTIYFNLALGFSESTTTALYHSFTVLCYFTPLIGAMIADGWLGKFRTILYLSMIYAVGNIVMTVTAIPIDGDWISWTPFIGLVIIAFGTGGIKPCVSAFGGDQFRDDQVRQKDSFFSLFYMSINIGSLLSTIITPLIRNNVKCFDQDCYAVAFAIPAGLMIVAIVCFAIGSRWYTKIPPGESILARMFGCIWTALRRKCGCCSKDKEKEKKDHWLDYAEHKYDKRFIADLKDVLNVCWLFLPLPAFWALFDQQGSRWTLQAKNLQGDMGGFTMTVDMMQAMNALLVILFVPMLESLIYPCLNKLKIPNRPLQRMSVGMILAGTAFVLTGVLQVFIDNESPDQVSGTSRVRYNFINTSPCKIEVGPYADIPDGLDIEAFMNTQYFYGDFDPSTTLAFNPICPTGSSGSPFNFNMSQMSEGSGYQIVLTSTEATQFQQFVNDFTPDLQSSMRVYNALPYSTNVTVYVEDRTYVFPEVPPSNFSTYAVTDELEKYSVYYTPDVGNSEPLSGSGFDFQNGALYTIMIYQTGDVVDGIPVVEGKALTEVEPRGINIFLQVPQYVVMTLGECLFSVTGLGFAYTQAAPSMKSILTSIWLLTVAIGNVVVVIVAETGSSLSQMAEFFLFAGIMYATTVIFVIMTLFYKYVEPRDDWTSDASSTTSDGSSNSSRSSKHSNKDVDLMKSKELAFVEETDVKLRKVKDIGDDSDKKSNRGSSSHRSSVSSFGSDTKF